MVYSSIPNHHLNPASNWNHQQQVSYQHLGSRTDQNQHHQPRPPHLPLLPPPPPPPPPPAAQQHHGIIRPGSMTDRARMANMPNPETVLKCPRSGCNSMNTKFCYYNNYSLSQPRYFCKTCRRYWTRGGALRNVPVGGGCRRNKRSSGKGGGGGGGNNSSTRSKSPAHSGSTPSNSSGCSSGDLIRRHGSHIQPPPISFLAPLNHLSDYNIAEIGTNYPGLIPPPISAASADHFNLLLGNIHNSNSSSGTDPWRFLHQQQPTVQVQQYHHPSNFFDNNLDAPSNGSAVLYGVESHDTGTEIIRPEMVSTTTSATHAGTDQNQLDLTRLENTINTGNREQLIPRPRYHSTVPGFRGGNYQLHQYNNWSGAPVIGNTNTNSNSTTTIAWTDVISGFSSSASATNHPA